MCSRTCFVSCRSDLPIIRAGNQLHSSENTIFEIFPKLAIFLPGNPENWCIRLKNDLGKCVDSVSEAQGFHGGKYSPRSVSSFKYPISSNPGVDIILLPSCYQGGEGLDRYIHQSKT